MRHRTRRRLDLVLGTAAVVGAGAAAAIGALVGDTERIGDYWLHADVADDGVAQVVEVIDYDFGNNSRRGILRNIPDVDPAAPITVTSETAPDDLQVSPGLGEVRLRVGDPRVTIRNRHRYRIDYPIETLVVGDEFSWDAVGTGWTVGIDNAEIHVTAGVGFEQLRCDRGRGGAVGGCTVTQIEPGHLLVEVGGLDAFEGVTVSGLLTGPAAAPGLPVAPAGAADDPGTGWLPPAVVGVMAAALAGVSAANWARLRGREQVYEGGAADAAFGPPSGEIAGVELVDHAQLAEMATIEFESPRGLSAAAGGIVHAEAVSTDHQIAWLIEAAIRDEVVLDERSDDTMTLRRGPATPEPSVAARLDSMFRGADSIELGEYDKAFAVAWKGLEKDLDRWRKASGLWDPAGEQRRQQAVGMGILGVIAGAALCILGGLLANRSGTPWLALVGLGGLIAGAGALAVITAWELRIRSAEGSGRWLQVESFRRFIANSEARHAEAAAKMGLLRQYTAWAVALGELDHWEKAVEAAAAVPGSAATMHHGDVAFVTMAPRLSKATTQTFTSPSSSGGGGGGGGVGGGGGGGGGGSW